MNKWLSEWMGIGIWSILKLSCRLKVGDKSSQFGVSIKWQWHISEALPFCITL